jgi:hypothetical protein
LLSLKLLTYFNKVTITTLESIPEKHTLRSDEIANNSWWEWSPKRFLPMVCTGSEKCHQNKAYLISSFYTRSCPEWHLIVHRSEYLCTPFFFLFSFDVLYRGFAFFVLNSKKKNGIYIIKAPQLSRLAMSPKKFQPSDPQIYDLTFSHITQNTFTNESLCFEWINPQSRLCEACVLCKWVPVFYENQPVVHWAWACAFLKWTPRF